METIGILSLLPPLLAIILAMATKQVLVSLFVAVWVGATLVNNYNPITGFILRIRGLYVQRFRKS